jgi:hypothetical protein
MPKRAERETQPRFFTLNFPSDQEMTAGLNKAEYADCSVVGMVLIPGHMVEQKWVVLMERKLRTPRG